MKSRPSGQTGTVAAALALVVLTAYAVLVPLVAGGSQLADLTATGRPPSLAHPFGTDILGHDLFVRVALSMRTSLLVALICAVTSTLVGALAGLAAATYGGVIDSVVMRTADAVNALPHLLLGIVVVAMFRGSLLAIVASVVITHWPPVARLVRSQALTTRSMEYVDAAYLAGATRRDVLARHVAPAAFAQVIVALTLSLPHAVWHESALSFLGIGLSPDQPSLGTMLASARGEILLGHWWTVVFPALPLVLVTLCIAVLGGALQRRLARVSVAGGGPVTVSPGHTGSASASEVAAVDNLTVRIPTTLAGRRAWVHAANNVSLTVRAGQVHALIGESGSGKSVLASVLTGLLPPGSTREGAVRLLGRDMPNHNDSTWLAARGRVVALAGQSAATGLTPVRTVGVQLIETLREVTGIPRADAPRRAAELFDRVGLSASALARYPHELSGGMAQRAVLAFALATDPAVLVADEPTAGLDPHLTEHVLNLLRSIADDGVGVLLITHDLAALLRSGACDEVSVMYAGDVIENGASDRVLRNPSHPWTRSLLAALPAAGLHRSHMPTPSITHLHEGDR